MFRITTSGIFFLNSTSDHNIFAFFVKNKYIEKFIAFLFILNFFLTVRDLDFKQRVFNSMLSVSMS